MFWNNGRFIFSGKKEDIKNIIPSCSKLSISEYEIIPFGDADVKDYFRKSVSDINEEELQALCDITRGLGSRMETVLNRYIKKGKLKDLVASNASGTTDLYDADFHHIFDTNETLTYDFFALLTYTEFPLQVPVAAAILSLSEDEFLGVSEKYKEFVHIDPSGICTLINEGFHKYLKRQLTSLKQNIELKILHVLQMPQYMISHCSFIPPLMKTLHKTDQLVNFLSRDNIQKILVNKHSQAALNEQCEFGYEACKDEPEKYAATLFRFALNKSMSREIEKMSCGTTNWRLCLPLDIPSKHWHYLVMCIFQRNA